METAITLLKCGADGGSFSLVLAMSPAGIFSYRLTMDSSFDAFLKKEDQVRERAAKRDTPEPLVIDWVGAIRLLDDAVPHWLDLYPLEVHPSVAAELETLLKNRYDRLHEGQYDEWCRCVKSGFAGKG